MIKKTKDMIEVFLADCRDRHLSAGTIRKYQPGLKTFMAAFPDDIPWEWTRIENCLDKIRDRKARSLVKSTIQVLYHFLERWGLGTSPIPQLKAGRHLKRALRASQDHPGPVMKGENIPDWLGTGKAVEDFFSSKKDLSPRTIEWYSWHLKPFITEHPELPLEPAPVEKYIFDATSSPEHRHGRFRALRALYHFLELRHQLPVDAMWGVMNPMRQIKGPKVPKKLPDSLDMPELQLLIDACQSPQDQALIALLADCGLRAGEIVSLTREKISQDFIKVTGKTGERDVSISPELRDILLDLVPSGPLFLNCWGKPFDTDGIYYKVRELLKRAGIEKKHMGPHMLRHTFGRQSIAAGADLVTVQKQMGHSTILTTRLYTELSNTEQHKRHQETSPLKKLKLNFH